MNYEYKVFVDIDETDKDPEKEKVLLLDNETLEHLKSEIAKENISVWEYKTIDNEIICDLDILRINKIEVLK